MSHDYSENILVQESAGQLLERELGWEVAFAYNTEKLGEDGSLLTNGGRVLNVTALGASFQEARDKAYEACDLIDFDNKFLRRDIGGRALRGRQAWD